jgi:hypothetical protein
MIRTALAVALSGFACLGMAIAEVHAFGGSLMHAGHAVFFLLILLLILATRR